MESKELAAAKRIADALCTIGTNATTKVYGQCAYVEFDEFSFRVDDPRGKAGFWSLRDPNKQFMGATEIFTPKRGCEETGVRKLLDRCATWRKKDAEQRQRRAARDEAKELCAGKKNVSVSVNEGDWSGGLWEVGAISVTVKTVDLPRVTAAILKLLGDSKAQP